jgi:signal transduction histidine kinase/DNA-binding response OmpR family regulator
MLLRLLAAMVLVALVSYSASGQRDSLYRILKRTSADTTRINIYHALADATAPEESSVAISYEDSALTIANRIGSVEHQAITLTRLGSLYRRINDYSKSYQYFIQAIDKSPQGSKWLRSTYLEAGNTLLRMSQVDSSMHMLERGLALEKQYPDENIRAALYNMSGNVRRMQNKFEDALSLYIDAVKLFEKQKNLAGLTQAQSNVGNIHNLLGNTDKALGYALQSLETAKASKVKSSIAYSNRLLGRIYRSTNKPEEALRAYEDAIVMYREIKAIRDVGETRMSIGNIYFDLKKYQEAMTHYEEGLRWAKSIPDTLLATYIYVAAGMTQLTVKNYKHARLYIDSSIVMSSRKGFASLEMDSYHTMADIYEGEGDYKNSMVFYKKYRAIRDSLTGIENRKAAAEVEARYQNEKKDDAIKILNAENELRASQQKYLIAFVILLLVVALVLYNRYTVKQKANRKLQDLDQIKSRFFTNVSHEFRTPLSLILGPLEEKLGRTQDENEKETLLLMQRNASRLQNLINQLLDLSRIEAGSMELHLEEGDIAGVLRLISGTFSSLAERKGISFIQEISDDVSSGCFDRDKIEKIINNLLSNAFKFTGEGGQVFFNVAISSSELVIEVRDSGIGIPPEKIDLIFNRFYQADDSITRGSEGSGIGLALTKELTELHRGTLTVSSKQGVGSVFTLTLPISRSAHSDLPIKERKGESAATLNDLQRIADPSFDENDVRPIVLIAEDNADMRQFIAGLLKDNYRIITAVNGKEALKQAQSLVPDLVISDWMMPEMDGRTLCENLKTKGATSHIPVLMLTARADQSSKLEGLETGADDYLIKPFHTQELVVRVQNLIEQRKKLRAIFSREMILKPKEISLPSRDAEFLSGVISLLEKQYADPAFGVEEFAQAVNMSRMQLHRKLKALTDESPGDFLRHFRLERSRQFLSVSGASVSEVCFKVGFNNVPNFSRAFKDEFGTTPTEFIQSVVANA